MALLVVDDSLFAALLCTKIVFVYQNETFFEWYECCNVMLPLCLTDPNVLRKDQFPNIVGHFCQRLTIIRLPSTAFVHIMLGTSKLILFLLLFFKMNRLRFSTSFVARLNNSSWIESETLEWEKLEIWAAAIGALKILTWVSSCSRCYKSYYGRSLRS